MKFKNLNYSDVTVYLWFFLFIWNLFALETAVIMSKKFISWGCPRGVMVKALDCGIVVSEFELQLRYSLSDK